MTQLLAIDVGMSCGWAAGPIDTAVPQCGAWPLPKRDKWDLLGSRIACLRDMLQVALEMGPDAVLVAQAVRSRNAGEAAYKGGLIGVIREECWRRRIRFSPQPENSVRKIMLGRGTGPTEIMKPLAMRWCEMHGIPVPSHDVADAVVLWSWGRGHMNDHPLGGLVRCGKAPKQPELRECV